ncbi:MAG: hypothetical protein H6Q98_864, partial [Nitrospirae bacterium]|nr:hypothetical protein [Nitrospirota bacterium]
MRRVPCLLYILLAVLLFFPACH